MPPYFTCNLLSSEIVELVAEKGKKRFFVHRGILPAQLKPTGEKINLLHWNEEIDLPDWDVETVGRFLQFLYTGDYQPTTPAPERRRVRGNEGKGGERGSTNSPDTVQSQEAPEDCSIYANPLLMHMKVYQLAVYTGVGKLEAMALERLSAVLSGLKLGRADLWDTVDFTGLLWWAYTETDDIKPTEPIRDLLSTFIAENIETLVDEEEIGFLLHEGGTFAADFVGGMCGRLFMTQGRCDDMEEQAQKWKDQANASGERVRRLEASYSNLQRLWVVEKENHNEKVRQWAASKEEFVYYLEKHSAETIQTLRQEARQSQATNAKNALELEAANKQLQQLKATNAESLRKMEKANTEIARKLEAIKAENRELKAVNRSVRVWAKEMEAHNERLREWAAENSEEIQDLKATSAGKVQSLEDTIWQLLFPSERGGERLEVTNEQAQEWKGVVERLEAENEELQKWRKAWQLETDIVEVVRELKLQEWERSWGRVL